MSYKVGDKVYVRYYTKREVGEVVEVDEEDRCVVIKWDNGKTNTHEFCEIRLDDPEADAIRTKAIQAKVDEATSAFEKAFQAFREAGELAGGEPYEIKNENVDLTALHNAINSGGWSTSSLYC